MMLLTIRMIMTMAMPITMTRFVAMTVKQHLSGDNPSETTQAKVEGNGEAKDEGEGQPGYEG